MRSRHEQKFGQTNYRQTFYKRNFNDRTRTCESRDKWFLVIPVNRSGKLNITLFKLNVYKRNYISQHWFGLKYILIVSANSHSKSPSRALDKPRLVWLKDSVQLEIKGETGNSREPTDEGTTNLLPICCQFDTSTQPTSRSASPECLSQPVKKCCAGWLKRWVQFSYEKLKTNPNTVYTTCHQYAK